MLDSRMRDGNAAGNPATYGTGVMMLVVAGLILGGGGFTYRVLDTTDPWAVAFGRSLFFCLSLGIICALRYRGDLLHRFRAAGLPGLVAGIGLAGAFTGYTAGMLTTTVANVMFILSAGPFFAAALGWLILRETVSKRAIAFMFLALCGILVMVGGSVGGGRMEGNLWAILATLGFAVAVIAIRCRPAAEMLPAALLGGAIALVPGWLFQTDMAITPHDWGMFVIIGGFQLTAGFVLVTFGSRHVRSAEVPLILMTEIVTAPLWAWAAAGEVPAEETLIGGAIVILAVSGQAVLRLRQPSG